MLVLVGTYPHLVSYIIGQSLSFVFFLISDNYFLAKTKVKSLINA